MSAARITARQPVDVAKEVERRLSEGWTEFRLEMIDGGQMLDQERLGAARYVAGTQVQIELAAGGSSGSQTSSGASGSVASEVPSPVEAR